MEDTLTLSAIDENIDEESEAFQKGWQDELAQLMKCDDRRTYMAITAELSLRSNEGASPLFDVETESNDTWLREAIKSSGDGHVEAAGPVQNDTKVIRRSPPVASGHPATHYRWPRKLAAVAIAFVVTLAVDIYSLKKTEWALGGAIGIFSSLFLKL